MTTTGSTAARVGSNDLERVARGRHSDPHRVLGRHGGIVRALRPDAVAVACWSGWARVGAGSWP